MDKVYVAIFVHMTSLRRGIERSSGGATALEGYANIATTRLYDRRQSRPEESPTFKVEY